MKVTNSLNNMTNFDNYKHLRQPIWIITLDDKPIVLPNGKCGWTQRRYAKSALSNAIGVDKCNEGLNCGKFKLIEIING